MANISIPNKKSLGFTLIELLVVVSIISLLSSLVLTALKDARNKAKISSIKEMAINLRTESQLYYQDNGNSYTNTNNGVKIYTTSGSNDGFFGSENGMKILNRIIDLSKGDATYIIKKDAWAIAFNTTLLTFSPKLINTAYAIGFSFIGTSYICLDSSGNNIYKDSFNFTVPYDIIDSVNIKCK